MTPDDTKRYAVIRASCDESLFFFTRYFFFHVKKQKFVTNWHHETICDALQKIERYEALFININISPRFSKTELAAINFIARGLGMNPSANYLYITASDELRAETSVRIRDIVTSEEYNKIYEITLRKDMNSKNLWRTQDGGGLKTATIFGQITGFGAGQMREYNIDPDLEEYLRDFDGCIILDDINKVYDAEKRTALNAKVNQIIFNTILSRKNTFDTPIILIQHRAGIDDATSNLLRYFNRVNKDKVINLVLPAIYEGKSLWEWKLPMSEIEALRKSPETRYVFQAQYMQNPQQLEGILFPIDSMKRFSMQELNMENLIGKVCFVDTADEGTDYYSAPIGYIFPKGEESYSVYVVKVIYTREPFHQTEPLQIEMINSHEIDYTFVETNKEGSLYVNNVTNGCPNHKIKGIRSKGNKITRILMQSGYISDFYFLTDEEQDEDYTNYFSDLTSFMKDGSNKHDDAPDSTAGLSQAIRSMFKYLLEKKNDNNKHADERSEYML